MQRLEVAKLRPELTNLCFEPLYYTTLLGYDLKWSPHHRDLGVPLSSLAGGVVDKSAFIAKTLLPWLRSL